MATSVPEIQRPLTAQEFYDNTFDILSGDFKETPNSRANSSTYRDSFSANGNMNARPKTSSSAIGSRPPSGYFQAGSGQLRAGTPGARDRIPPRSPLLSRGGSSNGIRPGTCGMGVDNNNSGTYNRNNMDNGGRPSTANDASLPLLRQTTADSQAGGGMLFSPASSNTLNQHKQQQQGEKKGSRSSRTQIQSRPSTSSGGNNNNRPLNSASSSSRYDNTRGSIGGLGIVARPPTREGVKKPLPLSTDSMKQTMYSDTSSNILDAGIRVCKRR